MFNRKFPFPEAHFSRFHVRFWGCMSQWLTYSPVFFLKKVYVFPPEKPPTTPKTHQKTASLHGGFPQMVGTPISHPKMIMFNRKTPWGLLGICHHFRFHTLMEKKPNENGGCFSFEATSLDPRPPWMLQLPWCRMQCCKHSGREGGRRCTLRQRETSGTPVVQGGFLLVAVIDGGYNPHEWPKING